MSRKDYILIARAIKETRDNTSIELSVQAIDRVIARLTEDLIRDNSNFDSTRFMRACR